MKTLFALSMLLVGCATASAPASGSPSVVGPRNPLAEVNAVLDEFHAAAARADFEAYFGCIDESGVFLGTDMSERWTKQQFEDYARGPFEQGRGWTFHSLRRDVVVEGDMAWFDEDLEGANMGPARGSGVLVRRDGMFKILQYNLAITIPNDRFTEVRTLLATPRPPQPNRAPDPTE